MNTRTSTYQSQINFFVKPLQNQESPSKKCANAYTYGFNGKENDNDVKGEGNQQDYGMRIYDPRLGRFLSVDPLTQTYPYYTPYQFAGNCPILAVDVDGLEPEKQVNENEKKTATDAGHGDKPTGKKYLDPGACTTDEKDLEKDYALKVENAVNNRLVELGVDNTRTRTGDVTDAGKKIMWRVNKANEAGASLLVSIHLNNLDNNNIMVYYEPGIPNETNSKKLGASIIQETSKLIGIPTDPTAYSSALTGVGSLGVLKYFKGEAGVLIEVGGIKSEATRTLIKTNAAEIGAKIADGMYRYMYGKEPQPPIQQTENKNRWHPPMIAPNTKGTRIFFNFLKE